MKKLILPLFMLFLTVVVNAQTGNVGIGTNTPVAKLEVVGNAVIEDTLNKPVLRLTHNYPGSGVSSNAAGLHIQLNGTGTEAKGLFMESTTVGGTLGRLLDLRNNQAHQDNTKPLFFVDKEGRTNITPAANTGFPLRIRQQSDANSRFEVRYDGALSFGDGTNATDVSLYRTGADSITVTSRLRVYDEQGLSILGTPTFSGLTFENLDSLDTAVPSYGKYLSVNGAGEVILVEETAVVVETPEYTLREVDAVISGISAGDTVRFNTIVTNNNIDYADGVFTLKAGKTYELTAELALAPSSAATSKVEFIWHRKNTTLDGQVGTKGIVHNNQTTFTNTPSAKFFMTPTEDTEFYLEVVNLSGTPEVRTIGSYVSIKEM